MDGDLRQHLRTWARARTGLLGVGNVDLGDDAAGVRLAEAIAARLAGAPADAPAPVVLDAGTAPERFLGRLAREAVEHVVFLDAVDFGAAPGAVVVADAARMAALLPQVSTHRVALGLLARVAEDGGRARAWLLGVQPRSLAAGAPLTPEVQRSVDALAALAADAWARREAA